MTISDNHSKILENLLNSGTQFFEFMQTLADAGQKNQESAHEELSARLFENYQRFYQEFIGKFLEAPQLGIYRETLHQFSAAIDAQHHFSVEVVQFLVKLGRPLEKSLKAVGKTLSSTPGGEFEFKTAQALHGHITAVLEQAYDDYLKSPVGVRDVADIIHRYVAYQEKLDDALDIWRKSLSIPMKKEMAEVYKGLYDLKKRVRQQNNLIDQQQKTIDRLIERIASLENKSDIKTGKKKTPT